MCLHQTFEQIIVFGQLVKPEKIQCHLILEALLGLDTVDR